MRKLVSSLALFCLLCFPSATLYAQSEEARPDSLKSELQKSLPDTSRVLTMVELCRFYQGSDLDSVMKYAQLAIDLSDEIEYPKGQASGHIMKGIALMYQGYNSDALREYAASYEYYSEIGLKKGMANCMNNNALIYSATSQYDLAMQNQVEAMKLYRETGNWQMEANSLNNIGLIYVNQMRYEEAFPYLQQSVKLMQDSGEIPALRNPYNNLALVYKSRGNLDSATWYFEKAIGLYVQANDDYNLAGCYNNLALVYDLKQDSLNALRYNRKALDIRQAIGDVPGSAISLVNIGSVYGKHHRPDLAVRYVDQAIHLSDSLRMFSVLFQGYLERALIDSANNKMDSAFYHLKIAMDFRDSMVREEIDQRLADMQVKYDTDEIKKQSALKDEQLQTERTIRWLIIGISAIVLLGLIVLAFTLRAVRRKNNLLASQRLEILQKNSELNEQNMIISEQKKEITDSISYAYNIQQSLLPTASQLHEALPDSFVIFRPRDIISGDFYFITCVNDAVIFAVADCTGHGVPGAMMSMLGVEELQKATQLTGDPGIIISEVNRSIRSTLKQTDADGSLRDGMDIAVCVLRGKQLQYAGAQRPLWVCRHGELLEYTATKVSVGGRTPDEQKFATSEIQLEPGDMIYLSSDGYADQFGGATGKKFMTKNLKALLKRVAGNDIPLQQSLLIKEFENWKGGADQVDDICVMGVRVT